MHPRLVHVVLPLFAACTVLSLVPERADAQRVTVRRGSSRATVVRRSTWDASPQLTLAVGALRYDRDGDDNHPMAALRAEWRLRRWLRSEVGLSYALADLETPATAGGGTPEEINSSLLAATLGLQAELPIPYVRPYVGAAAGLFARFDEDTDTRDGDSFVRPTMAFPVGLRFPVSPRLGIRAEARFRFDEHEDGRSATDVEQTVGVSFAF